MTTRSAFHTILSLLLAVVLLISTLPVSASDFSGSNVIMGSVSGVGIQLRGVSLKEVGTVFSGDRVRTGAGSHADMTLSNGNKAELGQDTELVVNQGSDTTTRIGLAMGAIGFTAARSPLAIAVGTYEITPKEGSIGTVGFIGPNNAEISVKSGSVLLRNVKSKQSIVFPSGALYLVKLNATGPIAESVSTLPTASLPTAAPSPAPQTPAGQTSGGGGGKKNGLIALAAAAVTITTVALGTHNEACTGTCSSQVASSQAFAQSILTAIAQAPAGANTVVQQQTSAILAQLQNPNLTPAQVNALVAQLQALANTTVVVSNVTLATNCPSGTTAVALGGNAGFNCVRNTNTLPSASAFK